MPQVHWPASCANRAGSDAIQAGLPPRPTAGYIFPDAEELPRIPTARGKGSLISLFVLSATFLAALAVLVMSRLSDGSQATVDTTLQVTAPGRVFVIAPADAKHTVRVDAASLGGKINAFIFRRAGMVTEQEIEIDGLREPLAHALGTKDLELQAEIPAGQTAIVLISPIGARPANVSVRIATP